MAGLDAGADDYLPKPVELDELLARLRALLRRAAPPDGDREPTLSVGDLRLDPAARRAWWAATELTLTKTEFDLLELLMRNAGSCSTTRRSTSGSGATTSVPTRTWPSTSDTCGASWPPRAHRP